MSTVDQERSPVRIFDELTLKTCHIRLALDLAIGELPEKYENVASLLSLLQGSLKDVNRIAEELLDRVPS